LQRILGTMIRAAPNPEAARALVDRAESTLGTEDLCTFCNIMLAVPAVIACADVGDLARARHHLQVAEKSLHLWDGTSWQAAVLEARAHIADAEAESSLARDLRRDAATLFERAGQPLDAARCRGGLTALTAKRCAARGPSEPRVRPDAALRRQASASKESCNRRTGQAANRDQSGGWFWLHSPSGRDILPIRGWAWTQRLSIS
jgi:hypothetical protein